MNHIFVSYSRTDHEWVVALTRLLSGHGAEIWLDQRSLPVSLPWLAEVRDAIDEAVLVLVCDSPGFRTSGPCASEVEVATQAQKPMVDVEVGTDLERAAFTVLAAVNALPSTVRASTELRVRARDWVRSGRPKGSLLSWREARRLRRSTADAPAGALGDGLSLLSASRRRNRRRAFLWTAILVAYFGGRSAQRVLPEVLDSAEKTDAEFAQGTQELVEFVDQLDKDVYQGMAAVSHLRDGEGFLPATAIQEALAIAVPDDAFTVDAEPQTFVDEPVGGTVRIVDSAGHVWERSAGGRDQREGQLSDDGTPPGSPRANSQLVLAPTSGVISVMKDNQLFRQVVLADGPATVAALSPDDRWLVASNGVDATLFNVRAGEASLRLRGAGGEIRDLAWSADGTRVWATTEHGVVSWLVQPGRIVMSDPDEWIAAVMPQDEGAWLLQRDGDLILTDMASGSVLEEFDIGHPIYSVTVAGDVALVTTDGTPLLVDTDTRSVRQVAGFACDGFVGRGDALADGTRLVIPCSTSGLLLIDLATAEVTATITVADANVAALANDRTAFVGSSTGQLLRVDLSNGDTRLLHTANMKGGYFTLSQGATTAVVAGYGGAGVGTAYATRDGSDWNALLLEETSLARSSTVFANGSALAMGFDDGTVLVVPMPNVNPYLVFHVDGGVRDMYYDDDLGSLVVVTRDGQVVAFEIDAETLNNRSLKLEVAARLQRAVELGLTPS